MSLLVSSVLSLLCHKDRDVERHLLLLQKSQKMASEQIRT